MYRVGPAVTGRLQNSDFFASSKAEGGDSVAGLARNFTFGKQNFLVSTAFEAALVFL
jgi:hypothetical protein